MFKKRTINEYFDIIKKNQEIYLDSQMVTHLDILGTQNKKHLTERYLVCINNFRELKKDDLSDDIRGSSITEKMERGAFSALLGMLLGGLFFAAKQNTPSVDVFGASAVVQGGFATAIGASCGALIYSSWDKSNEKPAHADFKACEEGMKKAGFTDERYTALSADLVKLFHFRECLLLGLKDKNKLSMREAFKSRYYSSKNAQDFDENDFNLAIEVYFLEQLNALFHQAFEKIHQIHDLDVDNEQQSNEFHRWFKRHFESNENRQKFSQQMQVQFIKNCINFLEAQMSQPGFLGRYLYLIDAMAGLVTASFAVGVFAVTTLFIPVFALISIAIAIGTLSAIATHLIIVNTDSLYYKRDKDNRRAIHGAIESITVEQKRLAMLLQKVVVTTTKDLAELKKYDEQGKSSFLKILQGDSPKNIALGSVRAWIREFTSRFNDSKLVKIDLSERIEALINGAHEQTESLQMDLFAYMASTMLSQSEPRNLIRFIKDTQDYLKHPDNADFIKTFESVQKIKEQVLEIVGYIPSTLTAKTLPDFLVNFYTAPISEGGLAGLKSDLEQARRIAPVVAAHVTANEHHPYQRFLDTAFAIQLKFNDASNAALILQGDVGYRKMLGLPFNQNVRIEEKINAANIHDYLNASFNFLCSLNQYETNINWRGSFQNIDPFILYRMLLVKQLANLTDPNNIRVDCLVKDEIKQFARAKLNYNPNVAFDDILNQALLVTSGRGGKTLIDKLGNPRSVTELSYIADAIRVDMAYVSTSLSPEQLISLQADHFLIGSEDKIILGFNSFKQLIPEPSKFFYDKIKETIDITTAFLTAINACTLLQQTGSERLYLQVISKEINQIRQQITLLKPLLTNSSHQHLNDVLSALDVFQKMLSIPELLPDTVTQVTPKQQPIEQAEDLFTVPSTEAVKEKGRTWWPRFHKHREPASASLIPANPVSNHKPSSIHDFFHGSCHMQGKPS